MNFVWNNSASPKGVLWIKQSLSHQLFMANSPHSEQGHIPPCSLFILPEWSKVKNDPFRQLIFLNVLQRANFVLFKLFSQMHLLGHITHSEFEIHDVISTDCVWPELWDGDYSTTSLFPCLWRTLDGGTRGNSCLGRRFLWASSSGPIHKSRQEARWDRTPTNFIWIWMCAHLAGCMCV